MVDREEREGYDKLADAVIEQAAELFNQHDNISRVISHLNLPLEYFEDGYGVKADNDDTLSFEGMVKLFIYKNVGNLSQEKNS